MAATNKHLAPSNKSRTGKATKFSSLKSAKPRLRNSRKENCMSNADIARLRIIKVGDGICQVFFAISMGIAVIAALVMIVASMASGHIGSLIISLAAFGLWAVLIVLAFFLVFAVTEIAINTNKLVQLQSGGGPV
jgi:hypothetical protein